MTKKEGDMTFDTLRRRALRTLSSPPEILYAVGRHWFAVAFCLTLGALVGLTAVSAYRPVYEGWAELFVNPGDVAVVSVDDGVGWSRRDELRRFLQQQVEILESDTVLRRLVETLDLHTRQAPKTRSSSQQTSGPLRQFLAKVHRHVTGIWSGDAGGSPQDVSEEQQIQAATNRVRSSITVEPNLSTGTIELRLLWTDRTPMEDILDRWIQIYTDRLVEMRKTPQNAFLTTMEERWKRSKDSAQRRVDEFKEAYPKANEFEFESLREQISTLRRQHVALEFRLLYGREPLADPAADEQVTDPVISDLLLRRRELNAELLELFGDGQKEASLSVQRVRRKIGVIEEQLRAEGYTELGGESEEEIRRRVEQKLADLSERIQALEAEEKVLRPKLEELKRLEEDLAQARRVHDTYEQLMQGVEDRIASLRTVEVQRSEEPIVSATPRPPETGRTTMMGVGGGLLIGIAIALLIEILGSKVRFKSDITEELALPILSVVPKR